MTADTEGTNILHREVGALGAHQKTTDERLNKIEKNQRFHKKADHREHYAMSNKMDKAIFILKLIFGCLVVGSMAAGIWEAFF